MKLRSNIYITMFLTLLFLACEEGDEMVLDRVASPVLVMIDAKSIDNSGNVNLDASFYELDKSGILDKDVGIDSIPVSGMQVGVYVNHNTEIESISTDSEGKISFASTLDELGYEEEGNVQLELAGTHNNVNFRKVVGF